MSAPTFGHISVTFGQKKTFWVCVGAVGQRLALIFRKWRQRRMLENAPWSSDQDSVDLWRDACESAALTLDGMAFHYAVSFSLSQEFHQYNHHFAGQQLGHAPDVRFAVKQLSFAEEAARGPDPFDENAIGELHARLCVVLFLFL